MNKHVPMRTCVVCGKRLAKTQLLRYARSGAADAGLVLDEKQTMPGRGLYVCDQAACRKEAAAGRTRRKKCLIRG